MFPALLALHRAGMSHTRARRRNRMDSPCHAAGIVGHGVAPGFAIACFPPAVAFFYGETLLWRGRTMHYTAYRSPSTPGGTDVSMMHVPITGSHTAHAIRQELCLLRSCKNKPAWVACLGCMDLVPLSQTRLRCACPSVSRRWGVVVVVGCIVVPSPLVRCCRQRARQCVGGHGEGTAHVCALACSSPARTLARGITVVNDAPSSPCGPAASCVACMAWPPLLRS